MPQKEKKKLGEILIEKGLITSTQLDNALKKANQTGSRIGSSLIMLGYVSEEQILSTLSEALSVPAINISNKDISVETQQAFPYDFVKRFRAIPIDFVKRQFIVAMEDPTNYAVIKEMQFKTNCAIKPALASSYQVNELLKFFEQKGYGKKPCNLSQLKKAEKKIRSLSIDDLLSQLVKLNGSDLHIAVGVPPSIRVNNKISRLNLPMVSVQTAAKLAAELLTDEQKRKFVQDREIEIAYMKDKVGRFRIVIYRQRGSVTICARNLKAEIPPIESLGLPKELKTLAMRRQGLILISGPAGHGKTTTLASIVNLINETRETNIITLEDPIEYLHRHKKSNVIQREIGEDTPNFSTALKHIFRQNPDVIVIGELRDADSISIAVRAAATGHLVLATLHAMDTPSTIDTMLNYFTGEEQTIIKHKLSTALLCVISQRLVPKKTLTGRVLASEIMLNSTRIANLIREGKTHQIKTQTTTAKGEIQAIEYSLARFYQRGIITYEEALSFADNEKILIDLLAPK
ncbi:PilT/PilU family type 4a pilus ATPase [Thermodesulfobacteriota bacterium]